MEDSGHHFVRRKSSWSVNSQILCSSSLLPYYLSHPRSQKREPFGPESWKSQFCPKLIFTAHVTGTKYESLSWRRTDVRRENNFSRPGKSLTMGFTVRYQISTMSDISINIRSIAMRFYDGSTEHICSSQGRLPNGPGHQKKSRFFTCSYMMVISG